MSCDQCLNKDECFGSVSHCAEEQHGDSEKYFYVGQKVTLKGRLFRVKSVKPGEIRLKLSRETMRTVRGELL